MTVLVIKTNQMEAVLTVLQEMGHEFVEEQHGSGPVHYACEHGEHVLEIYPTKNGVEEIKLIPNP